MLCAEMSKTIQALWHAAPQARPVSNWVAEQRLSHGLGMQLISLFQIPSVRVQTLLPTKCV